MTGMYRSALANGSLFHAAGIRFCDLSVASEKATMYHLFLGKKYVEWVIKQTFFFPMFTNVRQLLSYYIKPFYLCQYLPLVQFLFLPALPAPSSPCSHILQSFLMCSPLVPHVSIELILLVSNPFGPVTMTTSTAYRFRYRFSGSQRFCFSPGLTITYLNIYFEICLCIHFFSKHRLIKQPL